MGKGSSTDKMALSVSLDATDFNKGIEAMDEKLKGIKNTLDNFGKTNQTGFNAMGSSIESINPLLTEVISDLKLTNTEVKNIASSFGYSITQIQSLVTKIGEMKNVAKTTGETIQKDMTVSAAKMLPETTINEMRTKLAELEKARRNVYAPDNQVLGSQNKFALQEIDRLKGKLKELDLTEEQLEKQREKNNADQLKRTQKEIDGINRMIAAAQKSISSSYSGAIKTAENASSINQRTEALKNLKIARANLLTTDEKYTQKLQNLNSQISRLDRENRQATASTDKLNERKRNLMDTASQLQRRLALVFSVSAITGYLQKLVETRGEMELQLRSLESIIQSKQKANELFTQVTDLAVKSPFQLSELISYTKQLAAYRVETGKLFETTKMLADVSAGLGVDMQRLILAYGQVKAANYLRGQELRQFSESGINILGELAAQFSLVEGKTISVGEVFERVSKRMVTFADVEQVFKKLTSQGGIFYNMQEIQAETLKGQVSNLRDSIAIMMNEIGMANDGVLKGFVGLIREAVQNWRVFAEVLKIVAIGYGTVKVQQLILKYGLLSEYNALKMVALEENKLQVKRLQRRLVSGKLSAEEVANTQAQIRSLKQLTQAQYENILSTTSLSKSQAQLLVARNSTNTSLKAAVVNTNLLSQAEVDAAAKTTYLGRALSVVRFGIASINGAFKLATASALAFLSSIAPLLAVTAIFYGITKLISTFKEQNERIEENAKTYNDLRDSIGQIELAFIKATEASKKFGATQKDVDAAFSSQLEQIEKLKVKLSEIGVDYEIDIEDINITNIQEKFKFLNKILLEGTNIIESMNNAFIEASSFFGGSGEFFGNTLDKDFKQLTQSISAAGNISGKLDNITIKLLKNEENLSYTTQVLLDSFVKEQQINETNEQYLLRRIQLYKKLRDSMEINLTIDDDLLKKQILEFDRILYKINHNQKEALSELRDAISAFLRDNPQIDINNMMPEEKRRLKIYFDQVLIKQNITGLAAEILKQQFIANIKFIPVEEKKDDFNILKTWRDRIRDFQTEFNVKNPKNKVNIFSEDDLQNSELTISNALSTVSKGIEELEAERKKIASSTDTDLTNRVKEIDNEIKARQELLKLFNYKETSKNAGKDLILERTKNQIQAIKDAQKAYEEYLKYFSRDESIKKVKESFKTVFSGVGLKIDDIVDFDQASNIKLLESLKKGLKGASLKELTNTIANAKAEVDVKLNVQDIEKFKRDIQDEIDRYELTVEITKLGFSPELITGLFDEAAVTLNDLKRFYEKNAKDIGLSTTYKQLLKLSSKEQLALVEEGNQLRLEEIIKLAKKIEDIERKSLETRLNNYSKIIGEYQSYENKITEIRKKAVEDRANAEIDLASQPKQKEIVLQSINKKEAQDISQVLFDVIKNTELWAVTFENLEKVGDTALQVLYDQLKQYAAGAGKDLPISEFKELAKQIEKLEDQMKKRNPFKTIMVSLRGYSDAMDLVNSKQAGLTSAQLRYNNAVSTFGENSPQAIEALKGLDNATADLAKSENDAQKNAYYFNQAVSNLVASVKGVGTSAKATAQGVYDLAKALGYLSDESDTAYQSTLDLVDAQFEALDGVAQIIGGAYKKDTGMIIAGIGAAAQGTWNSIMAAIDLWGKDSKFQDIIVSTTDDLNELQYTFSQLEDVTFDSTNIKDFQRNFDELQANIQQQYASIEKLRSAEKSKKNADQDAIDQYTEDLNDLAEKEKELKAQRYAEAGIFELKSAIQEIADAWYEAYYAGEDTLNAVTNKVKEFVRTYIKQMMLMQGADVILANVRNAMIGFLEDDNFLDAEEMARLNELMSVASSDLNNFFESLSTGIGLFADSTGLSELQKGISAITESTAEALEALLNSIRLRMFEHYAIVESRGTEIVLKLEQSNTIANQILSETSVIRQTLQQMRLWQESITSPSHVSGGASIKVKAEMV